MFGATILSLALHAAALAAAVIVWPYVAPPLELPPDVVPVDLLTVADMTNVAPEEKAPEPPPVPEQLAMPAIETPPVAIEEPPPPPIDDEAPALQPEEKKEPEPEPPKPQPEQPRYALAVPRAKPKPEKPKEEFDVNKILTSLDNIEKKTATADTKAKAPPKAERTLKAAGAASALTMSEIDALKGRLAKCWNVPVGAPDPESLVFRVRFSLNEDGTVAGPPQLLDQGRLSDPYFRAAADAAIRAIQICGPYDLPPEKYAGAGGWNEITIEFDPRKMAGY